MFINFIVRGRLGNAIFRYMAIAIICLNSKGVYTINNCQSKDLNETQFFQISQQLIDKKDVNINCGVNMNDFYQHDTIYRLNKNSIIEFIKKLKNNKNPPIIILETPTEKYNEEIAIIYDILT